MVAERESCAANLASQHLDILMLGVPQIMWRGQIVVIPRRQTRALLFRLATRQEPVSRNHLCYLFWPDIPDRAARRCLTHLLTHLRLALPLPEMISACDDAVSLNHACTWTDTVWLNQLCCAQQLRRDVNLCWRALDVIRGPFLEGFSLPHSPEYELWVVQERQHWICQVVRLLSQLLPNAISSDQALMLWQPEDSDLSARSERLLARWILQRMRCTLGGAPASGL